MNFGKTVEKKCFSTRDAFRHGRIYQPVAREKRLDVMKFHLNRNIDIRKTGLVLQLKLLCLAQVKMA